VPKRGGSLADTPAAPPSWHPGELATRPFLIGIAGPSCAGKTRLAVALAKVLPAPSSILSLDSYYLPLSNLSLVEREQCNFDRPDALEWPLIRGHVRRLARGEAVEEPVYLFDEYTRAPSSRRIEAAPFVILEGLYALYDQQVRDALDLRVFVNAPDEVCFERRRQRDVAERGRTVASVCRQYTEMVRPMAEQFVVPTRTFAEVVIQGDAPAAASVAALLQRIPSRSAAAFRTA
jgi:uridine kinase